MAPSAKSAGEARTTQVRHTRDDVIDRIRRWAELYGEPPRSADWNPSVARWRAQEWRIERYRLGDPDTGAPWPSLNAVKRRFEGSFSAAVVAAGLTPHRSGPGRPHTHAAPAATPATGEQAGVTDWVGAYEQAAARARDAEARAAAAEAREAGLERALARVEARAERAERDVEDARRRARRAGERARRARVSRERTLARVRDEAAGGRDEIRRARESAALVAREAQERVRAAEARAADADARSRAAEDQAGAAAQDADRAWRALRATGADPLAEGLPGGPGPLADALRALSSARSGGDPVRLAAALAAVAASAHGWRTRL